jgi:hypothetical protein
MMSRAIFAVCAGVVLGLLIFSVGPYVFWSAIIMLIDRAAHHTQFEPPQPKPELNGGVEHQPNMPSGNPAPYVFAPQPKPVPTAPDRDCAHGTTIEVSCQ